MCTCPDYSLLRAAQVKVDSAAAMVHELPEHAQLHYTAMSGVPAELIEAGEMEWELSEVMVLVLGDFFCLKHLGLTLF